MERESQEQQPVEKSIEPSDELPMMAEQSQNAPEVGASVGEEPIYEFLPGSSQMQAQPPASAPLQYNTDEVPLEEAIRRGWLYPPPPSYYQNMPDAIERPPLPLVRPTGLAEPASSSSRAGTQALPPPYAPPVQEMPDQSASKRSRKWVWVVVAILGFALVVSCGLCGWGFYTIFNTSLQTTTGVLSVVDSYYSAIKSQHYVEAYQELAPQASISGLSEQGFIQQAQQRDQQYGQVTSYSVGQPSFATNPTTGPDLSHMTITVNVQRASLNYAVVLTLSRVGGSWKITDFDRI